MPNDPVDATRLGLRFAALVSALDDLPRQAKRCARWRARRDAIRAEEETASPPRKPAISLMSAAGRIVTGRCAPVGHPAGASAPSMRSTKS